MQAKRLAFATVAGVALLSGCVTREDIRGIQTDLYSIQQGIESRLGSVKDQTENVQTSQADLLQEIRGLSSNLASLQVELKDYQDRMSVMAARLDDLEASLTARMDTQIELLSGSKFVEKPLPSTVFNLANTDFARGKSAEAIRGFENYIKQFPTGERVAEARLKAGDAAAKLNESARAIQFYDDLVAKHPKDKAVPTALLRKGALLESQGKKSAAKDIYGSIIKSYPYAREAETAQERIRGMNEPRP